MAGHLTIPSSLMGSRLAMVMALVVLVLAGVPRLAGSFEVAGRADDYFVIKGGWYYPEAGFELDGFAGSGTRTVLERDNGFGGEIAFGHYIAPQFGVELGAGYFESRAASDTEQGNLRIRVVPVQLSGKLFLPMGSLEPYGALGVGIYVTKLEVNGALGGPDGSTRITYGFHGGVGINFNLTQSIFVGIEGRYVRARPEFGGQPVRLNGYVASIDLGFRY